MSVAGGDGTDVDGGGAVGGEGGDLGGGDGDEEAAGGFGGPEGHLGGGVDGGGEGDPFLEIFLVAEGATGEDVVVGVVEGGGVPGEVGGVEVEVDAAEVGHFVGVAEEAEAGDIGDGGGVGDLGGFGGDFVESFHASDSGSDGGGIGEAAFEGGGDDADAKWFGEEELVAGLSASFG